MALQWRYPPYRWRLKDPSNIVWIDALASVFPDARYCMTHGDIAHVIPSGADLCSELAGGFSDEVDLHFLRFGIEAKRPHGTIAVIRPRSLHRTGAR